jgi:hypothetical protein
MFEVNRARGMVPEANSGPGGGGSAGEREVSSAFLTMTCMKHAQCDGAAVLRGRCLRFSPNV